MTLRTIAGYRNTKEAGLVASEIEFRASGATLFANDPATPKASAPAPSV